MKISQFSSKNRTHFGENPQGISKQVKFDQKTAKKDHLQLTLEMFSSEQTFKAFQNFESPEISPRKNSGYSTHQEDESFDEDFHEICEDFCTHGACMKGADCELLHQTKDSNTKRSFLKASVVFSFPQLLRIGTGKRVKSFLA